MSSLALISAVICDEVRREASGEAIIIGAKQSGPPVGDDDAEAGRAPIAFYVELASSYPPPETITVRLRNASNEEVVFEHRFRGIGDAPVEVPEGAEATGVLLMVINQKESPVKEAGLYFLECSSDDDEWIKLRDVVFPLVEREQEEA